MTDILAMGEALVEFVKLPEPVEGRAVYRQGFGGDTSNAIIAAARQGASTGYITAVGGDPFGQELLDLWMREGVSTEQVLVKPQDPTGVYFVQPDPEGRKFSYARRGSAASLFVPSDLDQDAIQSAKVLHVSALSLAISTSMRNSVQHACEIAKSAGVLVSFDTNLRLNLWTLDEARKAIFELLPLADVVFPSDDEAAHLLGDDDEDAALDHFLSKGARFVLFKRGKRGPVLATQDGSRAFAPPKVAAVDSTGAGDSFAGGWLAHFLASGDPEVATRRAAQVAAKTVAGFGAVDPIPFLNQIE